MTDCLDRLKERITINVRPFTSPSGLVDLAGCATMAAATFKSSLKLTNNDDIINQIHHGMESITTLARTTGWCSVDEWVESCAWNLFKHPRNYEDKWRVWFNTMFDIIDQERNGYIDEEKFGILYHMSTRMNDTDFIKRAFASIDTDERGVISRDQYVSAYVKYLYDPDLLHNQLPLF